MVGHVPSPPHWTLLEIRWAEKAIAFYDSFACQGGYAADLERKMRQLLRICASTYEMEIDDASFTWIGEQVGHSEERRVAILILCSVACGRRTDGTAVRSSLRTR